jgi:WD40 repeat protein
VADAETGDTLVELRGHTDEIGRAAFTPDGTRVVTASLDDTARVWDAATGEIQVSLEHDSDVYLASTPLAPDGRYVLTVAGLAAWIWDVDSGELAAKLEHPDEAIAVLDAAFSPDGSLVATAANDGKARIWELQPPGSATLPTMRPELDNLTTAVRMVAFSPDGSLLAAANSDGSVGVWDVETGANLDFEQNHYDDVVTVAFSPDGGQILAVAEKTMTILQIEEVVDEESEPTVELYRYVEPSASWTNAAAWSPDGRQIVTAHQDGTARVFDVGTGQELMALRGHHNIVWTAAFSPDGDRIVTASEDGSARVWSVTSGADLVLEGHSWPVTSADFSPDGRRVVTAGVDETAIVWDAQSGELLHELEGDDSEFGFYPMWSAVFSRDGAEVLTAQETEIRTDEPTLSGAVARWDADSGRRLGICCTHPDGWPAVGADFVPGPRDRVVVFYGDSSVHLWSLVDDRDEWSTTGVIAAAVSPDGGQLVTIGRDKMAVVWDLESFERVREWETGLVSGLDFAPDGALVTAGLDGVIRVWDLRTPNAANETPSVRVEIQGSPGGTVITVGNSGDRSWIVAGGPDGLTKIFDAATGHLLGQLRMHSGAINSVSIADDGRIATASDDLTAKVYQCSVCGPIDTIVERARAMRDRLDDADE